MKKFAVIVAAGSGLRMNKNVPKQFLLVNGKSVLWYTLNTFLRAYDDMQIVLVLHEEYIDTGKAIVHSLNAQNRIVITAGGETRFHSVKNGLKFVEHPSIVFVHDGVRCLVSEKLIHSCFEETMKNGNAIPSIKPVDSLRMETNDGNKILDRNKIHLIQTPQTFTSEIILKAFEKDHDEIFTDEATVVEKMGVKINLIEGETNNIKITQPVDLIITEKILEKDEL
ncbi:MAG TPA: 2-C-methyl-D-erythritol 4-phosphate cytidylyltransferase [Puia sp.]|nr:2-C-methyl-D-erythritol 4-phosphate cytidylyltransferase [Puia sp.]